MGLFFPVFSRTEHTYSKACHIKLNEPNLMRNLKNTNKVLRINFLTSENSYDWIFYFFFGNRTFLIGNARRSRLHFWCVHIFYLEKWSYNFIQFNCVHVISVTCDFSSASKILVEPRSATCRRPSVAIPPSSQNLKQKNYLHHLGKRFPWMKTDTSCVERRKGQKCRFPKLRIDPFGQVK